MLQINNIYNDNCLNLINELPQNAFYISDPPYNRKYHYDEYKDNLKESEYKQLLFNIFGNKKSIIIHYPEDTINILASIDLGKCGDVVSWIYNSNTAKQHRLITWWNCKPDMKKIPQDYKNLRDKRIKQRIFEGKTCRGYDWWYIDQVKNVSKGENNHSCPIPKELAKRIILSSTNEGDLIIDPFMGSRTICVCAKELNRNYIGIELSSNYCKLAYDRLKGNEV